MTPQHFLERSEEVISMQTAKDMARMAFMCGKVCAAAQLHGTQDLDESVVFEAMQWQRFYDEENEKAKRNAHIHPLFRGIINDIGEIQEEK